MASVRKYGGIIEIITDAEESNKCRETQGERERE
jgi:hypothetical protein